MKKFWNFFRNQEGERILRLEGPIDEDSFWGDEVTPSAFREELEAEEGDVTVWVNSPGGNVFAAAEIYTMLRDYKGRITVKIDAIAASAASVVAMAGDRVLMSPVAMLMIHDPMTIAMGNTKDMEKAIATLNEVKESIINAYVSKTGLSRNKVAKLMSDETWLNAKKAVELGFADDILFTQAEGEDEGKEAEDAWQPYSTRIMGQAILNRLMPEQTDTADSGAEGDEAEKKAEKPAQTVAGGAAGSMGRVPAEEHTPTGEAGSMGRVAAEADTAEAATDSKEPAEAPEDTLPSIGPDGKTRDGAMPYELLMKMLELLR